MPDLGAIVERSSLLVIGIDDTGRFSFVNEAVEAATGIDRGELVESAVSECVHADDREIVSNLLEDTSVESRNFRLRRADDSWIRVEVIDVVEDYPAENHVWVISRELPAQVSARRKLERYEVILDSLSDAVYAIEPDGTIVYVNQAYADLKGVNRSALRGTVIYRWGSSRAADRIGRVREHMTAGEIDVGVVEFDFTTVNGDSIPVELRFNAVAEAGIELERVGVVRDISKRKEREDALERKNQRLEEFSSIVSHDLRNPLNVAHGRLELAMEDCESAHLDDVGTALDRMNALIDDLLTLAREGETVRDRESVDLQQVAEVSWQNVETNEARLDLQTDLTIDADRSRLQQLLENLFRNAVEHGGEAVTVTVGEVATGFYVEDSGPGIAPHVREDIFDAGFSTSHSGTGFGLSIVHQIATAHGWDIRVTDGTNGGARFEITAVTADP